VLVLPLGYDTGMREYVAGFDIGGTKISLAVAGPAGEPIERFAEPTVAVCDCVEVGSDEILCSSLVRQLERMLHQALGKLGVNPYLLRAIGIVSAGPIRDGALWCPPNIRPEQAAGAGANGRVPWILPLVTPLESSFSCPVGLFNDCSGGVLGEVYTGVGKDVADKASLHLAYATISTGFGVGAWDAGRLILGKDGNAGEFGHIVVERDGLLCGCGNRGCVEAYASGVGIVGNTRSRLSAIAAGEDLPSPWRELLFPEGADLGVPAAFAELENVNLTPAAVFEAAAQGDPTASDVIADLIYAAGIGLAAVANAYDPAVITVGGGIALSHPELIEPIREEMARHLNVVPPDVRLTSLGHRVTEFGALAVARRLIAPR